MTEKCYSSDEEVFKSCDIDEIVEDVFDDTEIKVGAVISIYEGDSFTPKSSSFLRRTTIEDMQEVAYEDCGEWAENWLEKTSKDAKSELHNKLCGVIDRWAEKHKLEPNFYKVVNIKEIKVRLLDENGKWEYV